MNSKLPAINHSTDQTIYQNEVLGFIPPDAERVLEIGCVDDALARRFKQRNPACRYTGITPGPVSGMQDKSCFDQLLEGDVSPLQLEDAGIEKGSFDCLVLHGDALQPGQGALQLKQFAEHVTEQGVVLGCFTNAGYWQAIQDIILQADTEAYQKLTGLQKTSACTLEDIQDGFTQAGLQVFNIIGVGGNDAAFGRFLRSVRTQLESLGIHGKAFTKRSSKKYFVVQSSRYQPDKMLYIQSLMLKPVGACNDIRILEPASALKTVPGIYTSVEQDQISIRKVNPELESRILIWQRPIMTRPESIGRLKKLIHAGYLVIVEFDDDPRRWQAIVDDDYLTFRGVHAVQTSTEDLAEFLRQFNPETRVFANQMQELPLQADKTNHDVVKIFFGALNREADWQPVIASLNTVLKEYGETLHMTVVHDKKLYNALETDNKTFHKLCGYPQYLKIMGECDIGLLPLEPTEFNHYKSDLKFIEHAAFHVVALASPVVYASSIRHQETGLLYHNSREFEENLRILVSDRETRSRLADNAYQWVAGNRLLGMHYRKRLDWYRELLDKLPELNRALAQRVPEIFN